MDILAKTKELCRIYNIKPARSKGQNFLIKEDFYDKIVETAELTENDAVLEVGPGLGFLTAKLAKKCKKVIAVELDDKLAKLLKLAIKSQKVDSVEVINENILDFDVSTVIPATEPAYRRTGRSESMDYGSRIKVRDDNVCDYKIVANLPYNITSIFLRKFLSESQYKPKMMVLMLQKEVAERICASPREIQTYSRDGKRISRGKPGDMSLLACSVQLYAKPEIVTKVPKNAFWPEPEVDSAIVRLTINNSQLTINEKELFRLLKIGFSAKRKMLKNNLANGYHINQKEAEIRMDKHGIPLKARAEDLSLEEWQKLLVEFV